MQQIAVHARAAASLQQWSLTRRAAGVAPVPQKQAYILHGACSSNLRAAHWLGSSLPATHHHPLLVAAACHLDNLIIYMQAEVLQMEPPELYVRQNPNPNAYTLAITGRKPFVVVHTSLLELLTLPELQAVIAHGEEMRSLCVTLRVTIAGVNSACSLLELLLAG